VRVLAVNHGPLVRSELFGEVILENGHELIEWHIGFDPPPEGDFDAVLVLGGQMNVGEEPDNPWLEDEYAMMRQLVDSELPLFAICLGAQTLANSFGGHVYRLPEQQVGFVEVKLTKAGQSDPVLGVLPEHFEALVGNHYAFNVPRHGIPLARSDVQAQAFRMGERAWAVQFHPEARRGQVLAWFEEDEKANLLPRPLAEIELELEAKIEGWHRLGRKLCLAFLAVAEAA
jgi:GMP synthase-like glutamine amidotransferase